jgi:hypothetical protein
MDELAWLARKYQQPPENYVYSAFCGKMSKDVPNLPGKVKEVLVGCGAEPKRSNC